MEPGDAMTRVRGGACGWSCDMSRDMGRQEGPKAKSEVVVFNTSGFDII